MAGGVGGVMDGMAWGGLCAAAACVDGLQWPKVIHALGVMLSMCLCVVWVRVCAYMCAAGGYMWPVCVRGGGIINQHLIYQMSRLLLVQRFP